ncbi:hypothetical protein DWV67_15385, partial [Dorea formicigenerans]
MEKTKKNVSGCYSKLVSCSRLFSTEIMQTLLTNDENCISPQDLESGIDVYVQLDPNEMSLYACVVSMLFDALMSAMLYRNIGQEPPVAFIIDEFG